MDPSSVTRSPYRRPKSALGTFFWRRRIWFESTFVFSMLEPWEKFLLLSIFLISTSLVLTGLYQYLPQHLRIMQRRAMYYLWGQEDGRFLWQWIGVANGNGGTKKEL